MLSKRYLIIFGVIIFNGHLSKANGGSCRKGFWGASCNKTCPASCSTNQCTKEHGICKDCKDGYYSIRCNQACPPNCLDKACYRYNVTCLNGCKEGWHGDKCTNQCVCASGVCERYSGNCSGNIPTHTTQSLIRSATKASITCPDDTRARCLNGKCKEIENGQFKCLQCVKGYTGTLCQNKCPQNCKSCRQNANICTECKLGFYGEICDKQCGTCIGGCTKDHGKCAHGCVEGYYNPMCNKSCSVNCVNTTPKCNPTNGSCLSGCKSGFYGFLCGQKCHKNCTFASKYSSCNEDCKTSKCQPGNQSTDCRTTSKPEEHPSQKQPTNKPKYNAMLTWFIITGVVVIGLLMVIVWFVIAPKKKDKNRYKGTHRRRRRRTVRECYCRMCTQGAVLDLGHRTFQSLPYRSRRDRIFFTNSRSSNHGMSWPRQTHHIPHRHNQRLHIEREEHIYEEVQPPPAHLQ